MKKTTLDLTNGNITKQLLLFTLPILIASAFQQLYNTADTMIVGNYLGDEALAAIGATTALYELLVGFAVGVGSGFSIVVARYYGADNEKMVKQSTAASIVLAAILSIIIMLISLFFLKPLLHILHTPNAILKEAHTYIFIICIFVPITLAYNLCSAILRSIGDSITPLIVLLFSSIVNIILDILFIQYLNSGIAGAAIATIIAQSFSVILCFIHIFFKCPILRLHKEDFHFDSFLYQDLITQGASMGFMMSIVSLGTLILQSAINSFGTLIIAGHTTARKLFALLSMPISTLSTATATFTSQNMGAGKYNRIIKGVKKAIIISFVWHTVTIIFVYLFAEPLSTLFGSNKADVINTSVLYLKTNIPFFYTLGPLLILRSALQGMGLKVIPLVSSIIELLGKICFTWLLIPLFGYLGVCFSEPVIWMLMTIQLCYAFYQSPVMTIYRNK